MSEKAGGNSVNSYVKGRSTGLIKKIRLFADFVRV